MVAVTESQRETLPQLPQPMVQPLMLATPDPRQPAVAVVAEIELTTTLLVVVPMLELVVADPELQDRPQTLPKVTKRPRSQLVKTVVITAVKAVVAKASRMEISAVMTVKKSSRTRTLGFTSITTWIDLNTKR